MYNLHKKTNNRSIYTILFCFFYLEYVGVGVSSFEEHLHWCYGGRKKLILLCCSQLLVTQFHFTVIQYIQLFLMILSGITQKRMASLLSLVPLKVFSSYHLREFSLATFALLIGGDIAKTRLQHPLATAHHMFMSHTKSHDQEHLNHIYTQCTLEFKSHLYSMLCLNQLPNSVIRAPIRELAILS